MPPDTVQNLVASLKSASLTVADAMLTMPKLLGPETSVGQARSAFGDDHVHALLIVADGGTLLSVVYRSDLDRLIPDGESAAAVGSLHGRTTLPDADLAEVFASMMRSGQRRLAVVDRPGSRIRGLLCLKRSHRGFCSDADVCSRGRHTTSGPAV